MANKKQKEKQCDHDFQPTTADEPRWRCYKCFAYPENTFEKGMNNGYVILLSRVENGKEQDKKLHIFLHDEDVENIGGEIIKLAIEKLEE